MFIPVPEIESRGFSKESLLHSIISLSRFVVEKARSIYTSCSIDNIPGYSLKFYSKVLTQAETLVLVIEQRRDYNTACALVRMLADNVCVAKLIYGDNCKEEIVLRHLLYVLDGVSQRLKELERPRSPYNGSIPKDTFDALMKQMDDAKQNSIEVRDYCISAIKALNIYTEHKMFMDKLIEFRAWKYDCMDAIDKNKPRCLSWNQIYNRVGLREPDMYSYFSQYVHGLAMSNLDISGEDDFDGVCGFACSTLGVLYGKIWADYQFVTRDISREELLNLLQNVPTRYLESILKS